MPGPTRTLRPAWSSGHLLWGRAWAPVCLGLAALAVACGPSGLIHGSRDGSAGGDGAARADGAAGADSAVADDAHLPGGRDATLADAQPGADDAGGDGGTPLTCDPGFSFTPSPPETGQILEVTYTSTMEGYAYVGLRIEGPAQAERTDVTLLSGQSPWAWLWSVALHGGGLWRFTFTARQPSEDIAACEVWVADTGPPPDLPGGPAPDCTGKVCGEDDGAGGTCTRCPMVGAEGGQCLDPPSPIGPSGPGQTWSCLDSAGCEPSGPWCRIWCPGEPCRNDLHPEGCPQGVEACWVDPHITDYEEACRQCCQSRYHAPLGLYACWDDTYNICRHPYDCGQPYPLP